MYIVLVQLDSTPSPLPPLQRAPEVLVLGGDEADVLPGPLCADWVLAPELDAEPRALVALERLAAKERSRGLSCRKEEATAMEDLEGCRTVEIHSGGQRVQAVRFTSMSMEFGTKSTLQTTVRERLQTAGVE